MMLELITYTLLTSLLVGLAALATERILAAKGLPRRGVWIISLIASAALPAAAVLIPKDTHEPPTALSFKWQAQELPAAMPAAPTNEPSTDHAHVVRADRSVLQSSADLDRVAMYGWKAATAALLLMYALAWLQLLRHSRNWPTVAVDGGVVRLSEGMQPAVLGYFRPQVIIPPWVLQAPPVVREMILTHEREHIAAGDPLLLLGALVLLPVMPWNLLMWWQLRRLRFALEVDCDARVLRKGANRVAYGKMLLLLGQSRSPLPAGGLALIDRASELERRIRVLVGKSGRPGKVLVGVLGALAVSLVATAAQLNAPALSSSQDLRKRPPEDISFGAQRAHDAARERFPEVFDDVLQGTAVITFVFGHDGTILSAAKRVFPEGITPTGFDGGWAAAKAIGADVQDIAYVGDEYPPAIGPWLDSKNRGRVAIPYSVLRWPIDSSRSEARVRAAVRKQFPGLFQGSAAALSALTVFMNEDGTVAHARNHQLVRSEKGGYPIPDLTSIEQFEALGIAAKQLGRRAQTADADADRTVLIGYAWPRRPDDDPESLVSRLEARPQRMDTRNDEAIIQRYFHDASKNPLQSGERRWLLLGRDGQILGEDRGYYPDPRSLAGAVASRFPGIKVSPPFYAGSQDCLGRTEPERQSLGVVCLWVDPDSPVANVPVKADREVRDRPPSQHP